jgi:shikimate kinase
MRIFLIGFTSSGKTTLGIELAKKLKYKFVDIDHFIEQKHQLKVIDIYKQFGEIRFREMEMCALQEILNDDHIVVSTGGGTPCFYDNMMRMGNNGITIYLEAEENFIFSRLKNSYLQRPLLNSKNEDELRHFISRNMKIRMPFYQKAKYTFKAIDVDANKVIDVIKKDGNI